MIILSVWEWVLNIFLLTTSMLIFVLSLFGLILFIFIISEVFNNILRKGKIFNIRN